MNEYTNQTLYGLQKNNILVTIAKDTIDTETGFEETIVNIHYTNPHLSLIITKDEEQYAAKIVAKDLEFVSFNFEPVGLEQFIWGSQTYIDIVVNKVKELRIKFFYRNDLGMLLLDKLNANGYLEDVESYGGYEAYMKYEAHVNHESRTDIIVQFGSEDDLTNRMYKVEIGNYLTSVDYNDFIEDEQKFVDNLYEIVLQAIDTTSFAKYILYFLKSLDVVTVSKVVTSTEQTTQVMLQNDEAEYPFTMQLIRDNTYSIIVRGRNFLVKDPGEDFEDVVAEYVILPSVL